MSRRLSNPLPGQARPGSGGACDPAAPAVPPSEHGRVAAVCLLLAAVTLVVFWPATGHGFVNFDDNDYVTDNPHVTGGLTWQSIGWAFANLQAGFWHPLTWLSILADCQLYGLQPWGHHLTSVLLHAANTVLLFVALRQMTGTTWRSAMVAVLFGLHPLHVESVAWASERKDVLSAFFWMLTLLMYGRYARQSLVQGPKSRAPYIWALMFFVCGLMSKPMVVTLPLVLLVLDWWPLQRLALPFLQPSNPPALQHSSTPLLRLVWEKVPFLAAALVSGVVTVYAVSGIGALGTATNYPFPGRLANALQSYLAYLQQTFFPARLAAFYPYPESFPPWRVAGAGLVGLMISALALWAGRKRPYLAVGLTWYGVTLLPVIGLIHVGEFSRADRFTYLPLIGVFVALVWGAHDLTRRWRYQAAVLSAAALVVTGLCAVLARQQLAFWKDSESLLRHAISITENNYPAHINLGLALGAQGKWDEAAQHFEQALRIKPGSADAHNNLGLAWAALGRGDEAIREFERALACDATLTEAHNNLGLALAAQGRWNEAISHYQQALQAKPGFADAHSNFGQALAAEGKWSEAIRQYEEALRSDPNFAGTHNNLGLALAQTGRWAEARAQYQQALALQPTYMPARINLARLLATCPQAALRNGTLAVELAREADRASGGENCICLDTLAAAYAEAGQFAEAVAAAQRALALAEAQKKPDVEEIRARLKLYQDRSPYHEPPPDQ